MPSAWHSRPGPRARSRSRRAAAPLAGDLEAVDHLAGAQQDGAGLALGPAGDVAAVVHAVGEVDVEVPRRAEHHLVALGAAAVGVGAGVVRAVVRLDLGEPDGDAAVGERRAEQARRGLERPGAVEEVVGSGPSHARWSATAARSSASCSATRSGAVPPRPLREATEPSTVRTLADRGRQARVDLGELLVGELVEARCRAPRSGVRTHRRARGPPGTARPRGPATRRCRWRARSPAARARPSARCRSAAWRPGR